MSYEKHVFICSNQKVPGKKCCFSQENATFIEHMKQRLQAVGSWGVGKIRVSSSGCLGRCEDGPSLVIYPENVWYRYETLADIDMIIEQHLLRGEVVAHLLMPAPAPRQ